MTYNISEESHEKETGEDSGTDSLNFTPEKHYVAAVDSPKGGDPAGAQSGADQVQEADSEEARQARQGASWAVEKGSIEGDSLAFTPTAGLFTSGPSVGEYFDKAIRDSGGVHQHNTWTSDPAPGVHRSVEDHTLTLEQLSKRDEHKGLQDQGAGRTFETQRHSHWSHDRWGG